MSLNPRRFIRQIFFKKNFQLKKFDFFKVDNFLRIFYNDNENRITLIINENNLFFKNTNRCWKKNLFSKPKIFLL